MRPSRVCGESEDEAERESLLIGRRVSGFGKAPRGATLSGR